VGATDLPPEAARAALARGQAAFPQLPLDEQAFSLHLARVLGEDAVPAELTALAIEDLYLACACSTGVPGAAALFTARYGPTVRSAVARIVRDADAAEIEQRVSDDLLVGSVTSPPKIASYAGRSPLERWLGVVAQREALTWLRENRAEARARDAAAAEPAPGGDVHPEMAFLKERYRSDFERALREALGRVAERERVLLRLHLVNGLTVEAIGKMYGVSQPTASRWLAAARETLLADVKATLTARLGTATDEIASLAGLVASRLDVSLSALLRSR
jgi:RNA polymerase sigma-70 factor (ECF subfamily)